MTTHEAQPLGRKIHAIGPMDGPRSQDIGHVSPEDGRRERLEHHWPIIGGADQSPEILVEVNRSRAEITAIALADVDMADGIDELTVEELVVQANEQFVMAQEYAQAGNWAGYGDAIVALEDTLTQLAELTGVQLEPAPIPGVDASGEITATDGVTE